MSVSTCSSRRPEETISSASSRPWAVLCCAARVSEMAITPFSGVRSSWLMLARKRDFSALAFSSSAVRASTRASSEDSVSRTSSRSVCSARASTPISSFRPVSGRGAERSISPSAFGSLAAASRCSGRTMLRRARPTTRAVCSAAAISPTTSTQEADLAADALMADFG